MSEVVEKLELPFFDEMASNGILKGIFSGVDGDAYHKILPGISKTDIELAAISPANMIARKIRAIDEDNEALFLGKMLHSRLEFHDDRLKWLSTFVQMPAFEGTGMKAAKAAWLTEHGGKLILTKEQLDGIEDMYEGVLANPQSFAFLNAPGSAEDTIYWIDEDSGMICKCRPDKRVTNYLGAPFTIDWKTTGNFSKRHIQDAIHDYGYNVSAAFTLDGMRANDLDPGEYIFVFIEKKSPNRVMCVPAEDIDVEIGRRKYKKVLKEIAEAQRTKIWPGFVRLGMTHYDREQEMAALEQE